MAEAKLIDISSGVPKPGVKKHLIIAGVVIAAIVIGAVCGVVGKKMYTEYQHQQQIAAVIDVKTFYQGITVAGVNLGGKTLEEAKTAVSAVEPGMRDQYNIAITYQGQQWKLTQDDFVFNFNTDTVLKEAYAYGREGDREECYNKVIALQTTPKVYNITQTMNYDGLSDKLKEMVKGIPYAAVDATVTSFDTKTATFSYADGKNGLSVDENKLFTLVENIVNGSKTGTVEVPTAVIPFSKTVADVKGHLQKLGTYSTTSTNSASGFHNMTRALASINGTCVPAGGTFSFHKTVGNSDQAHGYLLAGAILNGQLIKAAGGGICQTSTTIYGAALRSNMVITQRTNHTLQSSYCPIGQDAAVSYPELDFQFKNPTEYPVYIVTGTKGNVLTATFYGYQSPDYDTISVISQKTATIPAPTTAKYTVDKTLAKGVTKLTSKARDGARATAQRVFYKNGAVVKTENLQSSYYRAQPAYYSIGPNTAVSSSTPAASSKPATSKPASSTPHSSTSPSSAASSAPSSASSSSQPAVPSSGSVNPDNTIMPD